MVHMHDGSLDYDAHVLGEFGYLIPCGYLFIKTALTNSNLFSEKNLFSFACVQGFFYLPSNIIGEQPLTLIVLRGWNARWAMRRKI